MPEPSGPGCKAAPTAIFRAMPGHCAVMLMPAVASAEAGNSGAGILARP